MAHQQQIDFCNSVKKLLPQFFSGRFVLDIGSLDINGNNQYLFDDCLYLGVDLLPGRNVDLTTKGHELDLPDESMDVIISTECFEHDQFYSLTLKNIVRMLKPGGLFMFTCATTNRPEHGTRRTMPEDAPFIQKFGEWADYYKNLDEADIRQVLNLDVIFDRYAFSTNQETCDLYFWGIKKGVLVKRYDYSFQLQQSELRSALNSREAFIVELLRTISERDGQIGVLNRALANRD
jgi:SAM-dependent methyltransferase